MLYSTKDLDGYTFIGTDGEVGQAREVYFDDRHWVVRHVVADTGGWFTGHRVLISPHSIARIDPTSRQLHVMLTRERIKNAPDIDTDRPVSRQQEMRYYDYYDYPYYWTGQGLWGTTAYPLLAAGGLSPGAQARDAAGEALDGQRETSDPRLRSSKEVTGYDAQASDGDIGHIEDFLFDDRSWQIHYVVVDTRDWLPGRLVMVSPQWIDSIDWSRRRARFKVSREAVESSPPYQPGHGLSGEHVRRVQRHFGGWI
jgi:hypothetical protein